MCVCARTCTFKLGGAELTHTYTHMWTSQSIIEDVQGFGHFGSTRLQMHLKVNKSQSEARKHVAYFKYLF